MDIKQFLHDQVPTLDDVRTQDIDKILSSARESQLAQGQSLIPSGLDVGDIYIVLEGRIASFLRREWGVNRIIEHLEVGDLIAEEELEIEEGFECHFKAMQDSRLLVISGQTLNELKETKKKLLNYSSQQARSRTSRMLVIKYLGNLFHASGQDISDPALRIQAEIEWMDFEDQVLQNLKQTAQWQVLIRGEYLFKQGDEEKGAYILASGVLGVEITTDNNEAIEVARIKHGEIVGELALITDDKRSASIIALRECELFRLPSNEFKHIAEHYPRIMLNLYRTISNRYKNNWSNKQYRPQKTNIAIFQMHGDGDIAPFIKEFKTSLANLGSTELLTETSVDQQIGKKGISNSSRNDPGNISLMHWLNGRELKFDYVIYQAGKKWSNWAKRCASQSDQIIIVADTDNTPNFKSFNQKIKTTGLPWTLVLLHPEHCKIPNDSAYWLKESGATQLYHVRRGNHDDIDRLARILGGHAVSLVLSGGGARGFAHIGVLRALEELNIKIDMIGATSIGAPIAGWVAQGRGANEIKTLAHQAFYKLKDFTFPLTSMIQGKRIAETINAQTAAWDIEDYWIPFFCISTNLTTAKQVVHVSGNSARACRASVSIPGVLPPVPEQNHLLVDGGVMNNLPIDVMRAFNPSGKIIAIDVAPPSGSLAKEDYGLNLSGWKQLFRLFNPFQKPIQAPSIGSVIIQSMVLGSSTVRERSLSQGLADYYQNIHVKGVGLLEFHAVSKAEKIGYEAVIDSLRKWSNDASIIKVSSSQD